ncbi:MAG: fimbrillin family protein [Bacteroidales bacterium]|nr:fimbrillin family protein [Bacteroidales bacterium]
MKRYLSISLAVLAIAACQKPVQPEATPGKIQIEPVITKATEVNFENGDKIGLTIAKVNDTQKYADNALLTYDGSVFSSDLMWYADAYSEADVYAYYPYSESGTPTSYFAIEDQTEGIAKADLMAASKTGVLPTPNAITMVFKHLMTKIVVNIDNQSGATVEEVGLGGSRPAADIDIAAMAVSEYSAPLPDVELDPIKAFEATAGKVWKAIIIPGATKLELVVSLSNGKKISQPLAEMTLKSGGQYTINARLLQDNMIVSATGEIENWTDEGDIEFDGEGTTEDTPVEFTEYDGYFVYDGVEYKTVTLADGNTWMAENLRFIPRGMTVSSDPVEDAGIWYPAANADKVADPALAETLGLLYDASTAFGSEITADNAGTFEGTQGICPEGWHIPTVAEFTGLVGHCSNSALINTEGAYYDATIKGASLTALKEAGWEWQFASMRNKANTAGNGSYTVTNYNGIYGVMSYLIGSSMYQTTTNTDGSLKNIQYYYLMPTYNASNEKASVAYGNFLAGASIRCVKNK